MTNDYLAKLDERADTKALSLVGAVIANWYVTARAKPGSRWIYVCHDSRTGRTKGFKGYQLVRLAREAQLNGAPIIMPTTPWRDEIPGGAA